MGRKAKCSAEEKIKAVEDYLNGIRSVADIMNDLLISSTRSIRNWISIYKKEGAVALQPSSRNKSYSKEFKNELVQRYLNSEGSITDLCVQYGIKSHSVLQRWNFMYNSHIELKDYVPEREVYMSSARRKTTVDERREIVEYCIKHNRYYKGTASIYDVSYSQVYTWVKKYDQVGEESLLDKRGQHKTDEEVDELEKLRRENKRLKQQLEERDMTVELLKKVKEFERWRF